MPTPKSISEPFKTPLFDWHVSHHALISPFGGLPAENILPWAMPIQYTGIIAEHHHTREKVSIFDTCHMGEFFIEGAQALSDLERIVTCRIKSLAPGQCRYGYILNNQAGILDDTIVYKLSDEKFMMVVNSTTCQLDRLWIEQHISESTRLKDISSSTAKIDIQGPFSKNIIQKLLNVNLDSLKYFHFIQIHFMNQDVIISRTGYTGEWGCELYFPVSIAEKVWELFFQEESVLPAGLGARDTLRLEVGYPLYGQDLNESINPKVCNGMSFVDLEKDFIGQAALNLSESEYILVALLCEGRRSPRHDDKITFNSKEVGTVTSGSFSPSLKRGIALGYVKKEFTPLETPLVIQGEKSALPAIVTQFPFYKEGTARGKFGAKSSGFGD